MKAGIQQVWLVWWWSSWIFFLSRTTVVVAFVPQSQHQGTIPFPKKRNASRSSNSETVSCLRLSDPSRPPSSTKGGQQEQEPQQQRQPQPNRNNYNNYQTRYPKGAAGAGRPRGGGGGGPRGGGRQQQQQNRRFQSSSMSSQENKFLNQKIVQCKNAQEVLQLLASTNGALTSIGGAGKMNSVNFSTALHRIAKHVIYNNNNNRNNSKNGVAAGNGVEDREEEEEEDGASNNRSRILSDARFAFLVCSASEALSGGNDNGSSSETQTQKIEFRSRELCNMAWALTKLKLVPPQSIFPIELTKESSTEKLKEQAAKVRKLIYDVARERVQNNTTGQSQSQQSQHSASTWIPALSELCGMIHDTVSYRVLHSPNQSSKKFQQEFQLQEYSNLLWALATSQRANEEVVQFIITNLIQQMKDAMNNKTNMKNPPNNMHQQRHQGQSQQQQQQVQLRSQEWANSIWALATSGIMNGSEDELLPFVAELMSHYPTSQFLNQFKPQELSNTAWGVATILSNKSKKGTITTTTSTASATITEKAAIEILQHVAQQVTQRQAQGFKTQELTNTAWSFATLGFGLTSSSAALDVILASNTMRDYTILPSDTPQEDYNLMTSAMTAIIQHSKQTIRYFRSQELNNLAWTMARLDQGDIELMNLIGKQICEPRRFVTPQDIGTTLWSFATLEYPNKDVYRGIASRLTTLGVRHFKSQELSNTVWALATAEIIPKYIDTFDTSLLDATDRPSPKEAENDPITICFAMAAQELMRRPYDFKAQEIKDILWSFSKVGIRHPMLFKSVAEHLVGKQDKPDPSGDGGQEPRGVQEFSPQGIGNALYAYARQGQLACDVIQRYDGATKVSKATGRLAVYTAAFIDIGETLLKMLFCQFAETDVRIHDNLSKLKPQDLSNTAWALATYGMKHNEFLAAAEDQLSSRLTRFLNGKRNNMTRFKGQELANLIWAFATLNTPYRGLLEIVGTYLTELCKDHNSGQITVASISRQLKRQELANIAWCCSVFGHYPPALMKIIYMGLLGVGENPDPVYMSQAHGDSGIQKSAVMSLIYLQTARDLEGDPTNGLVLPPDFPSAWEQSDGSNGMDVLGFDELRLSTSKIQRDVGNAFDRIGFTHVQEHIISMDSLVQEYGIQMAATSNEILSLDIADVNNKIGIEVDGPAHFISEIDHVSAASDGGSGADGGTQTLNNGKMDYQFDWSGTDREINGPTSLKQRLMHGLGWKIINIPYWEWYSMNGDPELEEEYCRKILSEKK